MYSSKEVTNAHKSFAALVVDNYQKRCKRLEREETLEGLVLFMVQQQVIRWPILILYMILEKWPSYLYRANGAKTQAVKLMEAELPTTDRTIWTVLKDQSKVLASRKRWKYL